MIRFIESNPVLHGHTKWERNSAINLAHCKGMVKSSSGNKFSIDFLGIDTTWYYTKKECRDKQYNEILEMR